MLDRAVDVASRLAISNAQINAAIHVPNRVGRRDDHVCGRRKNIAEFDAVGGHVRRPRNSRGLLVGRSNEYFRALSRPVDFSVRYPAE